LRQQLHRVTQHLSSCLLRGVAYASPFSSGYSSFARFIHDKFYQSRLLHNDDNGRFVIPGKRSATRNPLCFRDSRFRENDGKLITGHFA
jgi:hypothetical protein